MRSVKSQWRSESGPFYNAYAFCHSWVHRTVQRKMHKYNLHQMKPNVMEDGAVLHWCHWCGLRAKENRAALAESIRELNDRTEKLRRIDNMSKRDGLIETRHVRSAVQPPNR